MADKGSSHWNGNYGNDEGKRRQDYGKAGAWDYFKAGAKDWVSDVKDAWSGNLHGPSMTERKKLMDRD